MDDFWKDTDVVYAYTRTQAIQDGVLVDVSELAREAGFRWPVAVTAAVWALVSDIPVSRQGLESTDGRMWDVLWMARWAAKRGGSEGLYDLVLRHGNKRKATLKLHTGPGDDGSPVCTILMPDED